MTLSVQLTLEQLQEKAKKHGLSEAAWNSLTIQVFGDGSISVTAYPGNAEGQDFLDNLDVPFATRTR